MIVVKVPDIGEFKDIEVIDIIVKKGDDVKREDPLITLESDKASMDIPSTSAGRVNEIHIRIGNRVSEGSIILDLDEIDSALQPLKSLDEGYELLSDVNEESDSLRSENSVKSFFSENVNHSCDVLVLGSGPGGYTAAFRASDLGKKVVLVERYLKLGGVCLNVGCIPSKALLHAAKVIDDALAMKDHGIDFGRPEINRSRLMKWKESIVSKLTGGLSVLASQRKVDVINGTGHFLDDHHLQVLTEEGKEKIIHFENAIIAAGSESVRLPFLSGDSRILDSTSALELNEIPETMLVIGGGIIGLEMATVYHALGSRITVVEMFDGLMMDADRELVKPFHRYVSRQYENIMLETKVTKVEGLKKGLKVHFKGKNAPKKPMNFDRILCAVGRVPNGSKIGAQNAGITVDPKGFITVDSQMRTNISHIFAIGDIVGLPMLAHKATHEGKVAAEVIAGMKSYFDVRTIPSVAYTDPEVAWAGTTEKEAKQQGLAYGKGIFPWAASGRSLALGRDEGLTKVLFEEKTGKVIGVGIVGTNAGDLISEGVLAIEMGADAIDLGSSIHPHPTLSETLSFSAETYEGTITDLYIPKQRKN